MPTVSIGLNYAQGGERITVTVPVEDTGAIQVDENITAGTGGPGVVTVPLAVTPAKLSSIYILVGESPVQMVTTPPGFTATLNKGKPFLWLKGSGIPCPFTAAFTALTFTNNSPQGLDSSLIIRLSQDIT